MKQLPNTVITVDKLLKRFDSFTAVNHVSFTVNKGEIFAFVGPNGAGKSTTIKILITLLKPTGGNVLIDKHNLILEAQKVREVIGYVPQMISRTFCASSMRLCLSINTFPPVGFNKVIRI